MEFPVDEMEASSGATVHGVVTELSPLKVSRGNTDIKYFSGKIGAGDKAARIISFKPELRSSLEKSRAGCTPVALLNCKVREGRFNEGLEIVASTYTKVVTSNKKIKLDPDSLTNHEVLTKVEDVQVCSTNEQITVVCKVLCVGDVGSVNSKGKMLKKQDCVVADCEGSIKIVLWEEHIGILEKGQSYKMENVRVREYGGQKYLSMSESAEVAEIEDIGVVVECDGEEGVAEGNKKISGEVVAVLDISDYLKCIRCDGKVQGISDVIGMCSKCRAKIELSRGKKVVSVKFVVEDDGGVQQSLLAFQDVVDKMVEGESGGSIEEQILSASNMTFFWSGNGVVREVKKN